MSTLLDSAATLDPVRRADLALNDAIARNGISDGTWSPQWSAAFDRETRALGHCRHCYETKGHASGCPMLDEEEEQE